MNAPINRDGTLSKRWKHGYSQEPLYVVWRTMLQRCYNPKHNQYRSYGGRGITVDESWLEYPTFRKWAIRSGYRAGFQIDRINTDGHYLPTNCRWVTTKQQQRNKQNNRLETFRGVTKTLAEWADDRRSQVSYKTLWERLSDGWSFKDALLTPQRRKGGYRLISAFGEEKSITEWLNDPRCVEIELHTLWKRINEGWAPERALTVPVRSKTKD